MPWGILSTRYRSFLETSRAHRQPDARDARGDEDRIAALADEVRDRPSSDEAWCRLWLALEPELASIYRKRRRDLSEESEDLESRIAAALLEVIRASCDELSRDALVAGVVIELARDTSWRRRHWLFYAGGYVAHGPVVSEDIASRLAVRAQLARLPALERDALIDDLVIGETREASSRARGLSRRDLGRRLDRARRSLRLRLAPLRDRVAGHFFLGCVDAAEGDGR